MLRPREGGQAGPAGAVQDELPLLEPMWAETAYEVPDPARVGRPGDKLVVDVSDAVEVIQFFCQDTNLRGYAPPSSRRREVQVRLFAQARLPEPYRVHLAALDANDVAPTLTE